MDVVDVKLNYTVKAFTPTENYLPELNSFENKDYRIHFTTEGFENVDYFEKLKAMFVFEPQLKPIEFWALLKRHQDEERVIGGVKEVNKQLEKNSTDVLTAWAEDVSNKLSIVFGSGKETQDFWLDQAKKATNWLVTSFHTLAEQNSQTLALTLMKEGRESSLKDNFLKKSSLEVYGKPGDKDSIFSKLKVQKYKHDSFDWEDSTKESKVNETEGEETTPSNVAYFKVNGLNIDTENSNLSLHQIITSSMFEAFNYFAYFTDTNNKPITDFEINPAYEYNKSINFYYLFFIDKIKAGILKMGDLFKIPYGPIDVNSYIQSSAKSDPKISFNILGDEILTFYRYITSKSLGMVQALQGKEEYFNLHIIVPGERVSKHQPQVVSSIVQTANAWHFTFENCKFVKVDKVTFTNKKLSGLPIHSVEMVYKQCWLKDEVVKE